MTTATLSRMEDKINTFSKFGDAGHGGITRYSLSPEAHQARDEFVKRMQAIGASIETDDMANIYATIPGSEPGLKRIVMGSHVDSVKQGGNYDGILGVMGAMEVLETIVLEKIPHRHPMTAMIWTNEEGSLYPPAMMVSGVVTGKFEKAKMLAAKSILDPSKTFGEALAASPYRGDEKNRLSAEKYQTMFELHIEQGPILEAAGKDIGVVTCVLGMCNYRIKTFGQADHAGTTPMSFRRDALYAAAQVLLHLHQELDKLDPALVYTTGEIKCHPCVHTVIPDEVDFCIDARHEDPEVLKQVVRIIKGIPAEVAKCTTSTELAWARDVRYFDKELVGFVKQTADELGIPNQYINSGAGHDAQYVSYVIPTTMIFVPSKDGHSHCEPEFTSVKQCEQGAKVMLGAVLKADKK
jgi:N-carbamoyl-L-amino-acid hydrolase